MGAHREAKPNPKTPSTAHPQSLTDYDNITVQRILRNSLEEIEDENFFIFAWPQAGEYQGVQRVRDHS